MIEIEVLEKIEKLTAGALKETDLGTWTCLNCKFFNPEFSLSDLPCAINPTLYPYGCSDWEKEALSSQRIFVFPITNLAGNYRIIWTSNDLWFWGTENYPKPEEAIQGGLTYIRQFHQSGVSSCIPIRLEFNSVFESDQVYRGWLIRWSEVEFNGILACCDPKTNRIWELDEDPCKFIDEIERQRLVSPGQLSFL